MKLGRAYSWDEIEGMSQPQGFEMPQMGMEPTMQASMQSPEQPMDSGAWFEASPDDNGFEAGAKAVGNLIPSAWNMAKGVGSAVKNVFNTNMEQNTVANLAKTAAGGFNKFTPGVQESEQNFDAFTNMLKERYGSLENLQKTATNDPFAFGSEVLGLVTGGANMLGKGAQVTNAISKVASPVTNVANKAAGATGTAARFVTAQATGLSPNTVTKLVNEPGKFTKAAMQGVSRESLAENASRAISKRIDDLSATGKEYQSIRESGQMVTAPKEGVRQILNKYGIDLDEEGKLLTSVESVPLSAGDEAALQNFITKYGSQEHLSSNAFLNVRKALDNLSDWGQDKTDVAGKIGRELRGYYDEIGKQNIKGLKELDETFAPEAGLLKQVRKDYLNSDGTLKDNAGSKIANLTQQGREKVLARLEEIQPGVTEDINRLAVMDDIERAFGQKVGAYTRAATIGGGAVVGGIPGAVMAFILTNPKAAVPMLRAFGYTKNNVGAFVNDLNNFKVPASMKNPDGSMKMGLSVYDITGGKKMHPDDMGTLMDFTDYVNGAYKPSAAQARELEIAVRNIVDNYELGRSDLSNRRLSNNVGKFLDKQGYDRKFQKKKFTKDDKGKFTGSKKSNGAVRQTADPLVEEARKTVAGKGRK